MAEVTYKAPLIKWAVAAEETGLPTDEAMDIIARENRQSFLSEPETCTRIEKARHFIFDEMMVSWRDWGYPNLSSAVWGYVSRFHASDKAKSKMLEYITAAYRRKGLTA